MAPLSIIAPRAQGINARRPAAADGTRVARRAVWHGIAHRPAALAPVVGMPRCADRGGQRQAVAASRPVRAPACAHPPSSASHGPFSSCSCSLGIGRRIAQQARPPCRDARLLRHPRGAARRDGDGAAACAAGVGAFRSSTHIKRCVPSSCCALPRRPPSNRPLPLDLWGRMGAASRAAYMPHTHTA